MDIPPGMLHLVFPRPIFVHSGISPEMFSDELLVAPRLQRQRTGAGIDFQVIPPALIFPLIAYLQQIILCLHKMPHRQVTIILPKQGISYPGNSRAGNDLADEHHSPLPFITFPEPDIEAEIDFMKLSMKS